MKANESCIWDGDCSIQNTKDCPIKKEEFDVDFIYRSLCPSYLRKGAGKTTCPPHDYEEYVLFNIFRYQCNRCKKEKK